MDKIEIIENRVALLEKHLNKMNGSPTEPQMLEILIDNQNIQSLAFRIESDNSNQLKIIVYDRTKQGEEYILIQPSQTIKVAELSV